MKTSLAVAAFPALFLALATSFATNGCSSDDSASTAMTDVGNVANGGECTQGAQCQSGVCGYSIKKACTATAGVCVTQSSCSVRTQCPCGGGPAFSECDDGVNAGQAVTGDLSCAPVDAGPPFDSAAPSSDAGDAGDASSDGPSNDASDSGDASDAAHD